MTFARPFKHLGNGYFSAWAALVAAYIFATNNFDLLRRVTTDAGTSGKELSVVFFASAVLFAQAVSDCVVQGSGHGRIWAITCSIFSLLICAAMAFLPGVLRERSK